ncbi:MAG: alpha/beta fold hydrolase [Mycobacterium sp.]|uniref:alpha/beta fold hydrolase n=1 Tax=Mycobacterium sp. TaxID=1785 RepID=UPI003C5B41A7
MLDNAVITGATGFVGSHFVLNFVGTRIRHAYVLVRGESDEVRRAKLTLALEEANNSYARRQPLNDILARLTIVECDIRSPLGGISEEWLDTLERAQPEELWHFAASLNFEDRRSEEIAATNLDGVRQILGIATRLGINRLLHCSTAYTCGTHTGIVQAVRHPEDGPFSNQYERTKCAAEEFLLDECPKVGVKLTILRPSVVVGNSETHLPGGSTTGLYGLLRELHQVSHLLKKSASAVRVYALERACINFIPVDVVMSQIESLLSNGDYEGICHLVAKGGHTNGEMLSLIQGALDIESCMRIVPTPVTESTSLEKLLDHRVDFYKSYFRADRTFAPSDVGEYTLSLADMRSFIHEGIRSLNRANVVSGFDFETLTTSDGAQLSVYSAGLEDRPVALICNAVGMPLDFVRPIAKRLATTCRVITWDSRGLPSACDGREGLDYGVDRQVADAIEVLEHFDVDTAVILGWCAGARLALEVASAWDGATAGLVLMNGAYHLEPSEYTVLERNMATSMPIIASNRRYADTYHRAIFGKQGGDDRSAGVSEVRARSTGDLIESAYSANADDIHLASLPFESAENLYIYASLLTAFIESPLQLSDLPDVPALLMTCAGDLTANPTASRRLALAMRRARLEFFPRGDHFSLYWQGEFVDTLAGFVEEVNGAPQAIAAPANACDEPKPALMQSVW